MAESLHPDDVSSLARHLAEQVAASCPHVPAGELAELTSRLALAEHAHATGVALTTEAGEEAELAASTPGNRIVWLPGPSASAIVLPAGEEPPTAGAAAVQFLLRMRRLADPIHGAAARGSAALRQVRSAVLAARQARARVQ